MKLCNRTMKSLAEKFVDTKRCMPRDKGGCERRKPLTEFPSTVRDRSGVGPKRFYGGRCADCQKVIDRARHVKRNEDEKAKRLALNPTGGKTGERVKAYEMTGFTNHLDRLFFCQVKPVPMSIELREKRRASI